MNPHTISLNGPDWQFKDFYGEDWRWRGAHLPGRRDRRGWRTGSVPGCPANDLRALGEIPNPYIERNSLLIEWIPARAWVYKKSFTVDEAFAGQRLQLVFKGVDYQAEFFLNGEPLGSHTGMFTPAAFAVSGKIRAGEENLLAVAIAAAPQEESQIGRTSRVQTVKGRMPYWWDFCPRMVHQGIWDDVFLEATGPVRIEDVFVRPQLAAGCRQAEIHLSAVLDSSLATEAKAAVTLRDPGGAPIIAQALPLTLRPGRNPVEARLPVDRPELWWPNGYGAQPLYSAELSVSLPAPEQAAGAVSDRQVTPFGIRRIELLPNEGADPAALPYTFAVNGRRLYIKGWNWVPLDVMYGVPRPEKLTRLLTLAQGAHVNLLRVWGGGLIEKDCFYDLCDRLGLLVWQEFIQSSSGIDNHPSAAPEHIDRLVGAAEQIIPGRRNHPSLALWCGGNELQSGPEQPLDDTHPALAALKAAVQRLDPGRLWLPTSSSGRVFSNSLENIARDPSALHDVHGPWEYQGLAQQYALYNRGASLFHSEFGVEALTNRKSLEATIAPEHQWPVTLDNPTWFHLGAWWVRRFVWDLAFGELPDLDTLVRATQFLQADGLRYALEADRRRKYHNSGTLPWQFNEPYPMAACTSAVDYYARPKPAYYAAARAYAPFHVSARFATLAWHGRPQFEAEVWASNSHRQRLPQAALQASLTGLRGKTFHTLSARPSVEADSASRLAAITAPLPEQEAIFCLDLRLSSADGAITAANRYIFTRDENLAGFFAVPQTRLSVTREGDPGGEGGECLVLANSGEFTALFVWLEDARPLTAPGYACFSDNYFCLFPGETQRVSVTWCGVPPGDRRLEIGGWNTEKINLTMGAAG